ncbi:MAG: CotH kinase family protein [Bacteroidaceae bacterium]|nr:CotH kinase family protein [Bacteroidaceae bacterium]
MKKTIIFVLLSVFAGTIWAQFGMPPMGNMPPMGGGMPMGMPGMPMGGGMPMGMQNSVNNVQIDSSNLPIIYIDTKGHEITQNKVDATMNITVGKKSLYKGNITIKLRGNSSLMMPQQKYSIVTRDDKGKKKDASFLGMGAEHDWVLLNTYTDLSLLRDPLAMLLWRAMGHWAPKTQTVEVVVNNKYAGVYILAETIKQGKERLDIATLKAQDAVGRELSGGYILRVDKYDANDNTFASKQKGISLHGSTGLGMMPFGAGGMNNSVVWTIKYPSKDKITNAQQNYIENYIHKFESVMASPDFADPKKGYAAYIKVSDFVDFIIHSEFMHNADMYVSSTYLYKTKTDADGTGGKLHAGPVWDYNFSMGNCTFGLCNKIDALGYNGKDQGIIPAFWQKLMSDPAFVDKLKERYTQLRCTVLSKESLFEYIDNYAEQMQEPAKRHFAAYSDLLVSENQNGGMGGMFGGMGGMFGGMGGSMWTSFMAYRVSSYEQEIQTLKEWILKRLDFLDSIWLLN